MRPNLHIADYCEAVDLLILADKNKIKNEIFNVGYQNLSIMQIAEKVKKVVEKEFSSINNIKIEREKTDDIRSYHINSDKIKKILNFTPKYSIEDAILELCNAFKKKLLTTHTPTLSKPLAASRSSAVMSTASSPSAARS